MSETTPWHHLYDAHCHPTDTLAKLQDIPDMRAKLLLIMATRSDDQHLVEDAARRYGVTEDEIHSKQLSSFQHRVVPAFGWHPWFSHQLYFTPDAHEQLQLSQEQKISHYKSVLSPSPEDEDFILSLPAPLSWSAFCKGLKDQFERFPLALLGEVGLDKSFRIPAAWLTEDLQQRDSSLTPGGREGRKLSPYRVSIEHQKRVLQAQLAVAGEYGRAASVHGVQAHGILYNTLAETWKGYERPSKSRRRRQEREQGSPTDHVQDGATLARPFPPRVCLHSYSGPAETIKQYTASQVPCDVYFSFSVTINAWSDDGAGKVEAAVRAVPQDRLLIESDLHTAGEDMDRYLEQAARKVCEVRAWSLEDGTAQLARNWKRLVTGREE